MWVYYAVYALLMFAAGVVRRGLVYWVFFFGLIVFTGFGYWVGCDVSGYFNHWNFMQGENLQTALQMRDPGHWIVIALLQKWGLSYTSLQLFTSVIFFMGFHALARRQPHPMAMLALAFPVLIINMPMSALRQAQAIGWLCFAFNAFVDRAVLRYVFFVIVAALFHGSAMLFLALVPFIQLPLRYRSVFVGIVLLLPGLYFMRQSVLVDRAMYYVDAEIEAAGALFRGGFLALSAVFFFWKVAPAWKVQFPRDYKLVSIGAIGMVLCLVVLPFSSVIADRIGYYLIPIQLLMFVRMPYLKGLRGRQFWTFALWTGLVLMFVVWTLLSWHFQECYVPYKIGIYPE